MSSIGCGGDFDCVCAINRTCYSSSTQLCLASGKRFYPYSCGGSYPGEVSWTLRYTGFNLTAASSPVSGYSDDDGVAASRGWCQSCKYCSNENSITNFTVLDPWPSFRPTPTPTNHSKPTATPSLSLYPSSKPTSTMQPTTSFSPTYSPRPTTRLEASKPPTLTPTSVPYPKPTTPGPTLTHKPTVFEAYRGPSLWKGWSNLYVSNEIDLPFEQGLRSCDLDALGDGTCDSHNNDMSCSFDGGDCCESTCSSNHDGGCEAFDCKAPNLVSEWPFVTT